MITSGSDSQPGTVEILLRVPLGAPALVLLGVQTSVHDSQDQPSDIQ